MQSFCFLHNTPYYEFLIKFSAKIAITQPPLATTAKVGTSINLTCGVETASVLEVYFRWKRNFAPLVQTSRIYTVKKGTRTSVLHIDNLVMTDIGMYTCVAITTGSVGSTDTAEAYLTVVGKFNLTVLLCRVYYIKSCSCIQDCIWAGVYKKSMIQEIQCTWRQTVFCVVFATISENGAHHLGEFLEQSTTIIWNVYSENLRGWIASAQMVV